MNFSNYFPKNNWPKKKWGPPKKWANFFWATLMRRLLAGVGPRHLALLASIARDLETREGAVLFTVQIRGISEPSLNEDVIVRLTNQAYGGDVRIDIPRDEWMIHEDATLLIELSADRIPSKAWPQVFDIELDLFVDGVWTTIVSSEPLRMDLAAGAVEPETPQR